MTAAHAPGKVILFGEHAVVYGRPAIAVPVTEVAAQVVIEDGPAGGGTVIAAHDLGAVHRGIDGVSPGTAVYPLVATIRNVLRTLAVSTVPDIVVSISSTIPIGRGMGSGAAVATAMVRALAAHLGWQLTNETISELVYQTEIIHHGTPSGIDNSVIVYRTPTYFVRGRSPQPFSVRSPFRLIVADTGVTVATREVVDDVRQAWERAPIRYDEVFDSIGEIAKSARKSIVEGRNEDLGRLMNENQRLLEEIGVSSPALEALARSARSAGAKGAKLCGAGRGGNMIALVASECERAVCRALTNAGAIGIVSTWVT